MKIEETSFEALYDGSWGFGLSFDVWGKPKHILDVAWTFWRVYGSFRVTWGEQDE